MKRRALKKRLAKFMRRVRIRNKNRNGLHSRWIDHTRMFAPLEEMLADTIRLEAEVSGYLPPEFFDFAQEQLSATTDPPVMLRDGTFSNYFTTDNPITLDSIKAACAELKPIATVLYVRRDVWTSIESQCSVVTVNGEVACATLGSLRVQLVDELPVPWCTDLELREFLRGDAMIAADMFKPIAIEWNEDAKWLLGETDEGGSDG